VQTSHLCADKPNIPHPFLQLVKTSSLFRCFLMRALQSRRAFYWQTRDAFQILFAHCQNQSSGSI
jgi:hypothetical protein